MLKYSEISKYEPGVVFSLLSKSFAAILNYDLEGKFRRYDQEVFANPDTVGACIFISILNGKAVGMASWDPRKGPEIAVIGHNCILPEVQNRGLGKIQMIELISRLKRQGFKKLTVTTGDHPFYKSADKMYQSCGFTEIQRNLQSPDPRYGSVDYELILKE
jgi:GNAT superfamily N-acetyltransferase